MMLNIRIAAALTAAILIGGSSLSIGAEKRDQRTRLDIRQTEPPPGTLPHGKIVLVDDGTCPAGQIKLIVGGSNRVLGTNEPTLGVPRQQHCVRR